MQKRIAIKNHRREIQLTVKRGLFLLAMMALCVIALVMRLGYLQIVKRDMYATLSTNNWLDLVPIEPTRGLIYDRNGVLLAENIPVFSLDIVPYQVPDLPKTLEGLKKIVSLDDISLSQFQKQMQQYRRFDEIPLKMRLSEVEVARFTENQYQFPGVLIKARLMRHYPYGESFSHVLGYVGRINAKELTEIDQANYSASRYIGKSGIEKFYEDDLHGTVGYQQVENDASGKSIRILKDLHGVPGKNIYLTIDSKLQLIVEKALAGHRGAVVAIQPATGQVLAMVSEPGYDPNAFVLGISQKEYEALSHSPDKPLYNRAIRGLYPFGSTIKPYFALQGLNTGTITENDTIYDPGYYELSSGRLVGDSSHFGHGTVNLEKAILASCDTYFYNLAAKMGIRRMDDILNQFGFGNVTGIDLDDELAGNVASPEWKKQTQGASWYPGDTINAGIGQGYMQVTPLQLAVGVATLANRGQRFIPYLQLGEQIPGGDYQAQQPTPLDKVQLRDDDYWDAVIGGMEEVVSSPIGTARRFGTNHSYTLAAKTGTAQVIAKRSGIHESDNQNAVAERFRDHHLFIVFAPVDHPQIAMGIITENSYATIEVARTILDAYLGNQSNANKPTQIETQKTGV